MLHIIQYHNDLLAVFPSVMIVHSKTNNIINIKINFNIRLAKYYQIMKLSPVQ